LQLAILLLEQPHFVAVPAAPRSRSAAMRSSSSQRALLALDDQIHG
jgi:hypothetical protein